MNIFLFDHRPGASTYISAIPRDDLETKIKSFGHKIIITSMNDADIILGHFSIEANNRPIILSDLNSDKKQIYICLRQDGFNDQQTYVNQIFGNKAILFIRHLNSIFELEQIKADNLKAMCSLTFEQATQIVKQKSTRVLEWSFDPFHNQTVHHLAAFLLLCEGYQLLQGKVAADDYWTKPFENHWDTIKRNLFAEELTYLIDLVQLIDPNPNHTNAIQPELKLVSAVSSEIKEKLKQLQQR